MSRIIVLGTGAPQADLIQRCKEKGLEVFACSYRSGDPGERLADFFEVIDIVDRDAVYSFAARVGADFIYSAGSDVAMPTALEVSERLGLPAFCPSKAAVICNTKFLLREALGDCAGNLKYACVSSVDDPVAIDYPFIMKPVDSQGQRGVCRIDSYEQFVGSFEHSMSFSHSGRLILEEFIEGSEISINTFSVDGRVVFFLPSDRISWNEYPGGIIHRHLLPSSFAGDEALIEELKSLVENALSRIGIMNGPAYFQIIISNNGRPKIIEVTPRLDGCHMWKLIRLSTGVDLLGMTVDALLGKMPAEPLEYSVLPCETEFLCLPPGEVFSKDKFKTAPDDSPYWYYAENERVRKMNGYMEKCGYVMKRRP